MNTSTIETVNAQVFVQVINSDRATQFERLGGWFFQSIWERTR